MYVNLIPTNYNCDTKVLLCCHDIIPRSYFTPYPCQLFDEKETFHGFPHDSSFVTLHDIVILCMRQ